MSKPLSIACVIVGTGTLFTGLIAAEHWFTFAGVVLLVTGVLVAVPGEE